MTLREKVKPDSQHSRDPIRSKTKRKKKKKEEEFEVEVEKRGEEDGEEKEGELRREQKRRWKILRRGKNRSQQMEVWLLWSVKRDKDRDSNDEVKKKVLNKASRIDLIHGFLNQELVNIPKTEPPQKRHQKLVNNSLETGRCGVDT